MFTDDKPDPKGSYRQCKLRKHNTYLVSWLPTKFANPGEYVRLRQSDGAWDDGWLVETASPPVAARVVERMAGAYRRQRRASDVVYSKIKAENEAAHR